MHWFSLKTASIAGMLVTALAAGAYITAGGWLFGTDVEEAAKKFVGDERFVQGGLRTANRDHFAVCLDTYQVDEGLADDALPRVVQALEEATAHPDWTASVGTVPPTVDVGCPAPPAALTTGAHTTRTGRILAVDVQNTEASRYKAFLYLVPQAVIEATFVDAPPIATQEMLRVNYDQAQIVTFGFFFTASQATDIEYLRQSLLVCAEAESEMIFYNIRATPGVTPNE